MFEMSLDDLCTWPHFLLKMFEPHEALLRSFHTEDTRISNDELWKPPHKVDYVPMALRPINPFYRDRQQFMETLRSEAFGKLALRAFHCTRLTDDEVTSILARGMTPLSAGMLRRRVEKLLRSNLISESIATRLIAENCANNESRINKIYFIFTSNALTFEPGVGDLFKYWGGESLYAKHDMDAETGPVLASVGAPRIIEAVVPVSDIMDGFLDQVMIQQFLFARGLKTFDRDFVSRTEAPVPAQSIKRLISHDDPDFEKLTRCDMWRHRPR